MSKCPKCGYEGPDYQFREFSQLWEINIETGLRTGNSWPFSKLSRLQTEYAEGLHPGTDIVIAKKGEFDLSGRLMKWSSDYVVCTSSDSIARKTQVNRNVREWFGPM